VGYKNWKKDWHNPKCQSSINLIRFLIEGKCLTLSVEGKKIAQLQIKQFGL